MLLILYILYFADRPFFMVKEVRRIHNGPDESIERMYALFCRGKLNTQEHI